MDEEEIVVEGEDPVVVWRDAKYATVNDPDSADESDGSDQDRWDSTQLGEAQSSLTEWADLWMVTTDPYVMGLSEAVRDNKNMTMWASLDPYERLPMPPSRRGRVASVVAQMLGVVRNVLVFVPVAITWWAIGEATDKFGQYNSGLSVGDKTNFLDFWQNGYGVLDDIKLFGFIGVKIQEIAVVDSLIIVAVVALTLLSSAIGQFAHGRSEKDEMKAVVERERIALVLTEALEGKRSASPESIAGSIADVLNDLVDVAREVRGAATQLEQASKGVGDFATQVGELNKNIDELSQRVALQVSGELVKAVDDLGQSVSRFNTSVVGDTSRQMGEVIAGLEAVSEQLERTGSSVEFGVKRLRDDLDAIHNQIAGT
jgi:methyl-accepting chemotaxis protein